MNCHLTTISVTLLHLSSFRYHIMEERRAEASVEKQKGEAKRRRCARKPTKANKRRSQDVFLCASCAFAPESKTLGTMYGHYVTCLPDFIRHLHAFFPTFLYPSQPFFKCPLCEKEFLERRQLEVHLGVDHKRVEAYLPKAKVIIEERQMEQAKKDTFEEKEVDKVEEEAEEIEDTETIKPIII